MRCALCFVAILLLTHPAVPASRLPEGFVYLRDIDASIAQDMRYAGTDNFIGRPLPGYGTAECILRRDVALLLKRVQDDLRNARRSLKVYDCYRPTRAVRAMARWSSEREAGTTQRFYPALSKRDLFSSGYISPRSMHSAGTAVDLTLIPANAGAPRFDPAARYGACTAPAAERAPDNSLDMGTGFDCFDTRSYTRNPMINSNQRQNRETLRAAMTRHGFKNYFREWWHYYVGDVHAPAALHDFPIEPR